MYCTRLGCSYSHSITQPRMTNNYYHGGNFPRAKKPTHIEKTENTENVTKTNNENVEETN